MTISTPSCTLTLPTDYPVADMLKFHQRDTQAFSEQVENNTLHKGIVWDDQAACLSVYFQPGHADVKIAMDGRSTAVDPKRLANHVGRMFGLTQPIDAFEDCFRQHPQIGPLLARQSGLRVPLAATPFEALTWAITGQQISVSAAVSMRRKLIKAAGLIHSDGLACYPDAARLARLSEDDFRTAGYSATKAQTLIIVSRQVLSGELPLDNWLDNPPIDELVNAC
jgi:DNA-3-methyladenine glycosylase II